MDKSIPHLKHTTFDIWKAAFVMIGFYGFKPRILERL